MNKLLFILSTLICTTPNLFGQHYVIPVKYVNAKNIAAILNILNGLCNSDSPTMHSFTAVDNNEVTVIADEQTYLKIQKLISEWDQPLPKVTLEVWDGEKWLY